MAAIFNTIFEGTTEEELVAWSSINRKLNGKITLEINDDGTYQRPNDDHIYKHILSQDPYLTEYIFKIIFRGDYFECYKDWQDIKKLYTYKNSPTESLEGMFILTDMNLGNSNLQSIPNCLKHMTQLMS